MHRRAVLELSRRHGTDLWCMVGIRYITSSPLALRASKRSFSSSPSSLEASEPPFPFNGTSERAGPRPLFRGPKFGGQCGSKSGNASAGLSAAENANRQAILSSEPSPPPSRPSSSWDDASRNPRPHLARPGRYDVPRGIGRRHDPGNTDSFLNAEEGSHARRPRRTLNRAVPPFSTTERANPVPEYLHSGQVHGEWRCPNCRYFCFKKHNICPKCDTPRPELEIPIPMHLRAEDWTCPECQYHCFGRNAKCPCCMTVRPELMPEETGPPIRKISDASEQKMKFRRLSRSLLSETQSGRPTNVSPDDAKIEAWERARPRPQYDERRIPRNYEALPAAVERDSKTTSAAGPGPVSAERLAKLEADRDGQAKKDDWSWDMSHLERLRPAEATTQTRKDFKPNRAQRHRGSEADDDGFDEEDLGRRRESRKKKKKEKSKQKEVDTAPSPLYLPEFISVSNLADVIGVRPAQFVQRMEEMGFEDVTFSHVLDAETAGLVAAEYGFEPIVDQAENDLTAAPEPEDTSDLPPRPPVVTIMGHVDHGKTTILDWLRKSSVAASEHGGITQHIGAFSVAMPSGKTITFLDTPGHAAFLEMRRRGADVTDIIVLVVAADDSVKPQTIEAIKHASEAKVPVIVAISKVDKEDGNPERVKQDLSLHGIHVEDYGGDVQAIPVSGKTGQGMLELEEAIIALSEMLDHRADNKGNAEGWVIEASTKSYGRVATALVRRGTLRPGDIIVAGTTWARIRTLRNGAGVPVEEATPGMPVEIDGWREQPTAGSEIIQALNEQQAKEAVATRLERSETEKLGQDTTAINEARRAAKRRQEEEADEEGTPAVEAPSGPKPINFIIKADVGGSVEAVLNSVSAVGNNEVFACILRSGVGPVSEFDVEHADAAKGHIISFNSPIDPAMARMAEARGVRILDHNIIYKLIDDVKATLSEHLAPKISHRVTGEAEVGQIFEITVKGREKTSIAGCKVRNGLINRNKKVRVLRGQEIIYDGNITSLRNVKKDVTEMRKDTECGIAFESWADFAVGDHIQCYEEILERRSL